MKRLGIVLVFLFIISAVFFSVQYFNNSKEIKSPIVKEKPLDKYAFENLREANFPSSPIVLGEPLNEKNDFISQMFYFDVATGKEKNPSASSGPRKVSGLLNVPTNDGIYPVIILLRGFVSEEIYSTGIGTKRAGEVFTQNGFITLAPDFLGYGKSDNPSKDAIEERFQTYTTVLNLLSTLNNLNSGLDASYSGKIKADISKIGIWGHSNGGQIALSVLEITSKNYPTVLWAPVSKPFPYSIFFFMDEFDDHGKALRKVVANFEKDYDIELYSPSNFYSWINAPIEIHQGELDDAVPKKWSDQLAEDLEDLEKDVTYFVYPNADHNLLPVSPRGEQGEPGWKTAIQRSVNFYREKLY